MQEKFSLIIPAAGLGKRLNFNGPKNLFNVSGKPILNWIIDQIPEGINELIIVTSEFHLATYQNERNKQYLQKIPSILIKVQPRAEGTLSAVKIGLEASSNEINLVIWGDQIGITKNLLMELMLNKDESSTIVLPLIYKTNPYVYFMLDDRGRILDFIETKETKQKIFGGLTDSGSFLITRSKLQSAFRYLNEHEKLQLQNHGECNFLSTFKILEDYGVVVKKLIHYDLNSTFGVNSVEDIKLFVGNKP